MKNGLGKRIFNFKQYSEEMSCKNKHHKMKETSKEFIFDTKFEVQFFNH